jgi:hypothetical protein
MHIRTLSIGLLFVGALFMSAIVLPLALWLASRATVVSTERLGAIVIIGCFVAVFFVGRSVVLPRDVARARWPSLALLTAWMVATMAVASGVIWLTQPVMAAAGVEHGSLAVVLACLVASVGLLDRMARSNNER